MKLPEPGEVFARRYRIEKKLGRGGFATVYLATNLGGREVALKVLEPARHRDDYSEDTKRRFRREMRVLAKLESPYAVRLLDHGEQTDGTLWGVFEYLPGRDLSQVLSERTKLDLGEAIHVVQQVLAALVEAHDAGLVHRDLKPENIRVLEHDDDPLRVKLLDFGIAYDLHARRRITKTGELVGTPRYMSPEQLRAAPVGPPSDIYSLGMIAFELLIGRGALSGNRWSDQFERLQSGHLLSAPELERHRPVLGIIQRMTALEPAERFPDARSVLAALDNVGSAAAPVRVAVEATATSHRWTVVAAAAVAAAGGALAFAFSRSDEPDRAPAPPPRTGTLAEVLKGSDTGTRSPHAVDAGAAGDMSGDMADLDQHNWSAGCFGKEPLFFPHAHFVPSRHEPGVPMPLVILLHTDGRSPEELLANSGLKPVAEREGFVVVAPSGRTLLGTWRSKGDGQKVVRARADALNSYCIDESRVFLVGTGDGGRKLHRFYREPWVRAVAVNSYLENHNGPRPSHAVPILWILPTHSKHVRLDGKPNYSGKKKVTLDELETRWLQVNGCSVGATSRGSSTVEPTTGGVFGKCRRWACEAPFEICEVPGGEGWVGTSATDFGPPAALPRAEKIWSFLSAAPPRPDFEDRQ